MDTQQRRILNYLMSGKSLTNAEAVNKFHAYRLSGQIFELKKKGYPIRCDMVSTINSDGEPCRYGVYTYEGEIEDGEA